MSQPQLTPIQKQFADIYARLSANHQDVLKCLSVIYETVSRTNLMQCLNQADYRNDQGKRFVVKELSGIVKLLEQAKLVQLGPSGARCTPEIVELASREAVAGNEFEKIAKAVEKIIPVGSTWDKSVSRPVEQGLT